MNSKKRKSPPCLVRYRVETDRFAPSQELRIALVSDLHGRSGDEILPLLEAEKPDLIAIAGDLLEKYLPPGEEDDYHRILNGWLSKGQRRWIRFLKKADALLVGRRRRQHSTEAANEPVLLLLQQMAGIAPVYYAPGNHERSLTVTEREKIRKSGALLLENQAVQCRVKDMPLTIGGVAINYDEAFLRMLSASPGVRVLLCHCPDYYDRLLARGNYDLILSGHAHGGQVRLFGKGLFAPGQGVFPKYDGGLFYGNFVVGRGLANTAFVPRLWNPRELVMVTLAGSSKRQTNAVGAAEKKEGR